MSLAPSGNQTSTEVGNSRIRQPKRGAVPTTFALFERFKIGIFAKWKEHNFCSSILSNRKRQHRCQYTQEVGKLCALNFTLNWRIKIYFTHIRYFQKPTYFDETKLCVYTSMVVQCPPFSKIFKL